MSYTPYTPTDHIARRRDAPGPTRPTTRAHDVEADGNIDGGQLPVGAVGAPAVPSESQTAVWLAAAEKHPE